MPEGHRAAASGLQSTGARDRTPQVVVVGVSAVTAYTAPHRSESERGDFSHVNFKFHVRVEGGMDLPEHVNLESWRWRVWLHSAPAQGMCSRLELRRTVVAGHHHAAGDGCTVGVA